MSTIPLNDAVLCACGMIHNARDIRGEVCPACTSQGQMLSLARVLNPSPEIGTITFILASGASGDPHHEKTGTNA